MISSYILNGLAAFQVIKCDVHSQDHVALFNQKHMFLIHQNLPLQSAPHKIPHNPNREGAPASDGLISYTPPLLSVDL